MTHAQDILDDAAVFYNADEYGETINYRPKNPLATPKDIVALIDPTVDDLGNFVESTILVSIEADTTRGIATPVTGDLALIRGRVCRLTDVTDSAPDGTHDLLFKVGEVE